jgi:hypothetical protein
VRLVVEVHIELDGVAAPAIFDEDAGVVIRRVVLQTAALANEQAPGVGLPFLQRLELEGITLVGGKLFQLRAEGVFLAYKCIVGTAEDGKSVIDAAGVDVVMLFVVEEDIPILTVLVEGEADIGVLPGCRRAARKKERRRADSRGRHSWR